MAITRWKTSLTNVHRPYYATVSKINGLLDFSSNIEASYKVRYILVRIAE